MKLFYKDFENPSYQIDDHGYLIAWKDFFPEIFNGHKNEFSEFFVDTEDNDYYCGEANIIIRINKNEDGYFDFSKNIIDIGAEHGTYSFKTQFNKIYSFEPNVVSWHLLNVNLMMHDVYDKAKTYNVMLSDKVEEVKYDGFTGKQDDLEAFSYFEENEIIVKTHTLDEYNINNVGLIKVDVEGMEEKVLRGGLGTIIRNNYPPILFELWDVGYYNMTQEKYDSLQKFLEDLGYEILWYWGDMETHLAIKH